MFRQIGFGAAAVLTVGALTAGCGSDGDTNIQGGSSTPATLIETRADSISTSPDAAWADNEQSINRASNDGDELNVRFFRFRDGSGLLVWTAGDDADEQLWVAKTTASGGVEEPHIVVADVESGGYGESSDSFVAAMVPNGGLVMAFIAQQDSVDGSTTDNNSDRVYYFTKAANGDFTDAVAVDTNSSPADGNDNNVSTLFIAGSRDFTQEFDTNFNTLEEDPSGGTLGQNGDDGVYFGWVHEDSDANPDLRIEGAFVDIDTLDLGTVGAISLPTLSTGENVNTNVLVSGDELLFRTVDGADNDDHIFLVRLNFDTLTEGTPIELDRGTSTTDWSINDIVAFVGNGFRPYNGEDSSWLILVDNNFTDGTVTNGDSDLVIFQVPDTGAVQVTVTDHESDTSTFGNGVFNAEIQFARGAPGAFVFFQQVESNTNATNDGVYVIAVRFNGDEAVADNVSDVETIQTTNDGNNDGEADVLEYYFYDRDPSCDPDTNNSATYIVYRQAIDETTTNGARLAGRTVTVDDPEVSPITITLGTEDVIVANGDRDWGTSVNGNWPVQVTESTDPSGGGIVFYVANGNSDTDASTANSFTEHRLFVFAPDLANGQAATQALTARQIDSDSRTTSPALPPFPQWYQLTTTAQFFEALVTPRRAADRDFAAWGVDQALNIVGDSDEAAPANAFVVFPEFRTTNDSEAGEQWMVRIINLSNQAFTDVADRFTPALTDRPARVSNDSGEFDDLDQVRLAVLPESNGLVVIFNDEQGNDGAGAGKFYANTVSTTGVSTEPALLTNDQPFELDSNSGPFSFEDEDGNSDVVRVYPSANCGQAIGSWFFWERYYQDSQGNDDRTEIQGRNLTGAQLP